LPLLQGWIHGIASWNPITAILTACRGFISGVPHSTGLAYACGAGLLAVMALWGITGLRRAERGE
jgi:ABC-type multidrug transport system permease subunit